MHFTDLFIRRPILSIVASLLILLVGVRALVDLPVRQFPELTNALITVTTAYPGAPPELMQGFITTPIERALGAVDGIDYMTSSSVQSRSNVTVHVKLNYDPDVAMTDVMAKVQEIKYQLPQEANDPVITKSAGQALPTIFLAFGSPELSTAQITDFITRVVQPILSTVPDVATVEILGGQPLAMRVWLDPNRMAARGITADDVAAAIRANNFQSAPGQTKGYFVVTNITADTSLTDVEAFRDMVVKSENGALIRLRDLATVELGGQRSDSSAFSGGQNAVVIGVSPTPSGNPLTLAGGVRALLPEIERALPPGVTVEIPFDSSEAIQEAIDEVVFTLSEAVIIVIVVIFLFLGTLRSVIIPIVTIPMSIIGMAMFALALGFSLNLLTMLAMVLAIGLVVDDAIVVVENVHRHMEEGMSAVEASLVGAREIVGPVVAMTITLAAVYAPIGFLGGLTGTLFREFAFSLAGAVIISGFVALTLSPMMCSTLLRQSDFHGRFAQAIDRGFARVTDWYGRRLATTLDFRPVVGLFAAAVLAAVGFLFVNTQAELAPQEDQGVVISIFEGPQYANINYMEAYTRQVDAVLAAFPEGAKGFQWNGREGQNSGLAALRLKPWNERERSAMELLPAVQERLSTLDGVNGFAFTIPPLPGGTGGLPVGFVISGPVSYEDLYETMETIKVKARDSGLFMVTNTSLNFNNPVVNVEIDRAKANMLGIRMDAIARTLATLVGENYVNRFSLEGRSYEVIPQVPRSLRFSGEDLRAFYVRTASGDEVPLSTVVKVSTGVQPNALTRYNQLNSATFQAVPMPGVAMGDAVAFLQDEAAALPREYVTAFLSEARQYIEEGNQLFYTFGFALIIIYLVLAAQFESLRDPLVILVSVPMSICGALLPLFFGLSSMNIYTQVGLVTLIGLISKHGILMVAFARDMQIKENADRRTAIEHAARVRLRPILMTTAAMVAGLLPLIFATGSGAAARYALGLVVVAGMTIGTVFTLFVLPTVYTWIATDHRAVANSARARAIEAAAR
ncbi:MAG: efflux RND transporter permease subunit [Rhodospirillaceae bacterium]|nr:efflux RND transporter permease subunit [Rhodospirillaceae bacterium]